LQRGAGDESKAVVRPRVGATNPREAVKRTIRRLQVQGGDERRKINKRAEEEISGGGGGFSTRSGELDKEGRKSAKKGGAGIQSKAREKKLIREIIKANKKD